jgi:hypothetical protein
MKIFFDKHFLASIIFEEMKKHLFFIIIIFFLSSCSNTYEQTYSTYQEFEKANERNKSWFPNWIDNSCSELKSISSVSNNESIGRFTYKSNGKIDSILSEKATTERINTNAFQIMLVDMKTEMPNWFIAKDKVMGKTIWKYNEHYLAKDTIHHIVYFLCKRK